MKRKIILKIFCTFLVLICVIPIYFSNTVNAASLTSGTTLSAYGFSVNSKNYKYTHTLAKYSNTLIDGGTGQDMISMTTRVWVCRETNSTYDDAILTWTEIEPLAYQGYDLWGYTVDYMAYPESLTVSASFPTGVEYLTSAPKSQTVATTYSIGVEAAGSGGAAGGGFSAGVSGSQSVTRDCLVISNKSSSTNNAFKVFYDYKPGLFYSTDKFSYIGSTSEQIGTAFVHSTKKNYTFTVNFSLNTAYTNYMILCNMPGHCAILAQARTITTTF
jgi:hypothetical protein